MIVNCTDKIRDEEMETRDGEKKRGADHIEDEEWTDQAWDDLTREELPAHEVRKGRHKEIGYIEGKKVWRKMTRKEAHRRGRCD